LDGLCPDRKHLLETRGLLVLRIVVPKPPKGDTFKWLRPPTVDIPGDAKWYIDGSLFNGLKPFAKRTGFGVVVTSSCGDLLAYGNGVPPDWVKDASGAEAWALAVVLRMCPALPDTTTDCLNLVRGLESGRAAVTDAASPLARIWADIFRSLDDECCQQRTITNLRWMPAHGAQHSIGVATKSDGVAISPLDWRANRLVDALAKLAAQESKVPKEALELADSATAAVSFAMAKLGAVTHAANHFPVETVLPDGTITKSLKRDSTACRPGATAYKRDRGPIVVARPCSVAATPCPDAQPGVSLQAAAPPCRRNLSVQSSKRTRKRKACDLECAQELAFQEMWRANMAKRSLRSTPTGNGTARFAALRERVAAREAAQRPSAP
jgi:hypothetical protein